MPPQNDEYQLTAADVLGSSPINKKSLVSSAVPLTATSIRRHNSTYSSSTSATNCCRVTHKNIMRAINCSLLILLCLTAFVGSIYLLFDPIIQRVILNRLVLRNDTEFAAIWANPPITPHLKLYFFNLTNPEQFFAGEQGPVVKEVGPYVYHQKWVKKDVVWHGNGTMSYRTKKEYDFQPELSFRMDEDSGRKVMLDASTDLITTVNVPMISAIRRVQGDWWKTNALKVALFGLGSNWSQLQSLKWLNKPLYDWIVRVTSRKNEFWVKKTPSELTWGYPDSLLEIGQLTDSKLTDKFGFFIQDNNTDNLPKYTMYTGEGDPYSLSKISLFDGSDSLKVWGSNPETDKNKCNLVQGSDGATFNPYIEKSNTLWFFNDQLCQSMPLVFKKEVTASKLPGYRFVPRHDVFKQPRSEPANACFCEDEPLCDHIGDGMFSISKCPKIMNAPIVLSWPHFLRANNSFIEAIDGMKPDQDKHEFFFDVQPITGTTLSARARAQINIAVLRNSDFSGLDQVDNTIVPLLWFDEGLDELGEDLRAEIAKAVEDPPIYKGYVLVFLGCCVGVVVAVGTISAVITCRSRGKRQHHLHHSLEDEVLGGQDCFKPAIGVNGLDGLTGGSVDAVNIKAVRQIINEKMSVHPGAVSHRGLLNGGQEEVHMRLLSGSGSSTEASTADNSRLSSASHSRNSSTGSNTLQPGPSNTINSSVQGTCPSQSPAQQQVASIPEVSSSSALLDPDVA